MFGRLTGVAGLAVLALLVTGCGSSSPSAAAGAASSPATAAAASSPAAGSGQVKTATIGGVAVLTNAAGFTLYWFAPDTSTTSKCTGACAAYWPPVKGPVAGGSGVTGALSTITRSDGTVQATYEGHPLYTYVTDTAPGQAKGNGINDSGGLWHEATVSGTVAPAASASASAKSGGYGY